MNEQAINTLTEYGFGLYSIPTGYAVADPLDGPDGFYVETRTVEAAVRECLEFSSVPLTA